MEKDENKELNISKLIRRYPFNGRSNYLIDKFFIIGYNIQTLKKLLFDENDDNLSNILPKKLNDEDKNKSSINIQAFNLKEEPVLFNEIASDYSKDCLDFDIIKQMILPNKLTLYLSEEELSAYEKENKGINDENESEEFSQYEDNDFFDNDLLKENTVVFSSNPQAENNSKKSINGFGYIFYKKLRKRKFLSKKVISFYIPIVFSIISEFPFYNSFYNLSRQIRYLFSYPKIEVPIEIMLSNIITNTQSPINNDVILSIRPFCFSAVENKNVINTIPEIINEDEEQDSNIDNELSENNILRKKTSDNFIKKELSNKSVNVGKNKINKKFLKKHSQNLDFSPRNTAKNENEAKIRVESPLASRRNNEINNNDRKKRKTYSVQAMNSLVSKGKKKRKNKNNNCIYDNYKTEDIFQDIKFGYLRGYPLIQYNLAKVLFHTLSPLDIIEIFFYTFLEKDVIFFSKNLQYLSLTINSYLNLNFPLNDEKYYFINATVSFDNYINGNSAFVGSTFTTIIGINSQYQSKYINSSNKLKEHLVVDLDKGEIYKIEDKKDKKGSKKNKELFSLIKKICKKEVKSDKKQTILAKEVFLLFSKLNEINALLKNNENDAENTEQYKLFKDGDFLDYDDGKNNYIKKNNLEIQESFYRLIINLCLYFYQNLSIKTEIDDLKKDNEKINKTKMNVIFRDDYKYESEKDRTYINEELYFLEELRETMKYESFVYGFVQSYSPIDLYKIPLTFTEEFLSIISRKSSILEKDVKFLDMIDQLYGNKMYQTSKIDFNQFFAIYFKKHKNYFDREIKDKNEENILNEDLVKTKHFLDESTNQYFLKYKDFELDNNILMDYLNIMNNSEEDDQNYLLYCSEVLRNNIPKNILVIDIENLIENYSIETKLLSKSDLCCSNIILLFALSLNFLDSNIECQSFLANLFQEFTVFRKYYSYIMNMIYVLFSKSLSKQNYIRANFYLMSYFICINSIRNLKLVPNESLMNIMNKFNDIDIKKFHEIVLKHQNNDEISNLHSDEEIQKVAKEPLTNYNLYFCYNFNKNHFFKESEIIDKINESINNDFSINVEESTIQPKIRYNNNHFKIESSVYSQTSLLTQLINAYNKYIVDLNEIHLGYKLLIDSCVNILIFMRNCNVFKDKDEIKYIIEIIFYLFLNKIINNNNK